MNAASIAILAVLAVLVGLAVRHGWKKGVPCSCGCNGCGKCKGCKTLATR